VVSAIKCKAEENIVPYKHSLPAKEVQTRIIQENNIKQQQQQQQYQSIRTILNKSDFCYFSSSPGLMAITFPSTTATAPLVEAATKSLAI